MAVDSPLGNRVADGTEFRTERLVLRPFRPADVDDSLAYRNDAEFSRFLPWVPHPFTRRDAEEFVARNIVSDDLIPTFAIVLDGRVIGTVNLDVDPEHHVANLGYAIARARWGQGIAVEAARAVVGWGFDALGLAKIRASTDVRNEASWRVMEKLGMRREGILRSHAIARGERIDEVCYGLLRSEWSSQASWSLPLSTPVERGPGGEGVA